MKPNAYKYIRFLGILLIGIKIHPLVQGQGYGFASIISNGLQGPMGMVADNSGNLYVANFNGENITKYDPNGNLVQTISGSMHNPQGVAVDVAGNIYVANFGFDGMNPANNVTKYNPAGNLIATFSNSMNRPAAITLDGAGNFYVGNQFGNNVTKYDSAGNLLQTITGAMDNPIGIDLDNNNNLYVASALSNLTKYSSSGNLIQTFTNGVTHPSAVVVDAAGHIFLANSGPFWGNGLTNVTILQTNGAILQILTDGMNDITIPYGLALGLNGDLFVADLTQNRVLKYTNSNPIFSPGPGPIINNTWNSADFTGDGFGDVLVYRSGKTADLKLLDNYSNELENVTSPLATPVKGKLIAANRVDNTNYFIFKTQKTVTVGFYIVNSNLAKVGEFPAVSLSKTFGKVKASGDLNQDGILDLISIKGKLVKVLYGPTYSSGGNIINLLINNKLPGKIVGMYSMPGSPWTLVFQKGKTASSFLIGTNLLATAGPSIAGDKKILGMSGATPITQKGKVIMVGTFTYTNSNNNHVGQVVGPK